MVFDRGYAHVCTHFVLCCHAKGTMSCNCTIMLLTLSLAAVFLRRCCLCVDVPCDHDGCCKLVGCGVMNFCASCLLGRLSRTAHTGVVSASYIVYTMWVLMQYSSTWGKTHFPAYGTSGLCLYLPCQSHCVVFVMLYGTLMMPCCYDVALPLSCVSASILLFCICYLPMIDGSGFVVLSCTCDAALSHLGHLVLSCRFSIATWFCLCHATLHLSCCVAILVMYCL